MNIKETKSYSMAFSGEEAKLIDSLVRERVGNRTIGTILDEAGYVLGYYSALFTMIKKVYWIGHYADYDSNEINILVDLLSTAYNDGKHDGAMEMIKEICDGIDIIRG